MGSGNQEGRRLRRLTFSRKTERVRLRLQAEPLADSSLYAMSSVVSVSL